MNTYFKCGSKQYTRENRKLKCSNYWKEVKSWSISSIFCLISISSLALSSARWIPLGSSGVGMELMEMSLRLEEMEMVLQVSFGSFSKESIMTKFSKSRWLVLEACSNWIPAHPSCWRLILLNFRTCVHSESSEFILLIESESSRSAQSTSEVLGIIMVVLSSSSIVWYKGTS